MIRFSGGHYNTHQEDPDFLKSDFLFDMLFNVIILYLCKLIFEKLRYQKFKKEDHHSGTGKEDYKCHKNLESLLPGDVITKVCKVFLESFPEPTLTILLLVVISPVIGKLTESVHKGFKDDGYKRPTEDALHNVSEQTHSSLDRCKDSDKDKCDC